MRIRIAAHLATALLVAAAAFSQVAPTQPQTLPAATRPDPADAVILSLVDRLGDTEFAQREAAQKQLEKLDYHAIAALRRVAATCTDAEVAGRLIQRARELEEQCALAPPPISLTLKNADWATLITEFQKAVGGGENALAGGGYYDAHFTIDAREKPFWEVYKLLSAQDAISLSGGSRGVLQLSHNEKEPIRNFTTSGPFLFAPREISRVSTTNFQSPGAPTPPTQTLRFVVAVDPRVNIVRSLRPALVSVVDDADNQLLPPPGRKGFMDSWDHGGERYWNTEAALTVPAKPGKKITSAKGHLQVEIALATEQMNIADPKASLNKPFEFQGRKLTITRWKPNSDDGGDQVDFRAEMADRDAALLENEPDSPATFELIDSTGSAIGHYVLHRHGWSGSWGAGKAPFTLRLTVATKTKVIDIPFEFKDLPLP